MPGYGREGVFFPVDPGADATLGGMVADRRLGHDDRPLRDDARERRSSLTVVAADGRDRAHPLAGAQVVAPATT